MNDKIEALKLVFFVYNMNTRKRKWESIFLNYSCELAEGYTEQARPKAGKRHSDRYVNRTARLALICVVTSTWFL